MSSFEIVLSGDENNISSLLRLLRSEHPYEVEECAFKDSGRYKLTLKFLKSISEETVWEFFRSHGWRFCSCNIEDSVISCDC